jgi:hypothetical protein
LLIRELLLLDSIFEEIIMPISSNLTILIIVLCAAGFSLIGYVIYRMCWLDRNGKNTNADTTVGAMLGGMTPCHEQQQYMKKVRDRYRGNIETLEAGLDRFEAPPKKRFWQSVETFDSYEGREDMYDYDLRTPKSRFAEDKSMDAGSEDWL